jgi:hypothetical protein
LTAKLINNIQTTAFKAIKIANMLDFSQFLAKEDVIQKKQSRVFLPHSHS